MNRLLENLEIAATDGEPVRLLSVDIFDTLLFRAVGEPAEVFERMPALQSGLIPGHFDGGEWRNLRVRAEQEARRLKHGHTGSREVTLTEIYAALPKAFTRRDKLMEVELAAEKSVCFVNPRMLDALATMRSRTDCAVVLTSDMYLSKSQLLELLQHAGFDPGLADDVFVSCEHGVSKRDTNLFRRILERYGVKPNEVLHVGDDVLGDMAAPASLGIRSAHYEVISGSDAAYPYLELEALQFGRCVPELRALRCLAAEHARAAPEEEQFWRQTGAMIFGPLCTGFAEWVLDKAEDLQVFHIFPFMREGAFFSRLLRAAAAFRSSSFHIQPLYVSRRALFLPSLGGGGLDPEQMEFLLHTNDIRVRDLFDMLGIVDGDGEFNDYSDMMIGATRSVMVEGGSVCDRLGEYLRRDDVQEAIRVSAGQARDALRLYLEAVGLRDKVITLDIGYRGTMQCLLEKVLQDVSAATQCTHLIMTGNEQTVTSLMQDIQIEGYLGTCGCNQDMLDQCHVRLLDLFMMCDEGTTCGYEVRDGHGVPVLEREYYLDEAQARQTQWVQDGVLDFLRVWHEVARSAPAIREWKQDPGELFKPVARLLAMPLPSEAQALGRWSYDENMSAQRLVPVIDSARLDQFKTMGLSSFLTGHVGRRGEWFAGMMALSSPYFFIMQHLAARNGFEKTRRVLYAETVLQSVDPEEMIVIAGAGEAGRDILRYLRIGRPNLCVEAFIDNNKILHGSRVNGVEILPFSHRLQSRCYVIGSLEYAVEIRRQLIRLKGNAIRIIQFRD